MSTGQPNKGRAESFGAGNPARKANQARTVAHSPSLRNASLLRAVALLALVFAGLFSGGCATERWHLSTVARKPDFEIHKPLEMFAPTNRAGWGTNGLVFVEPGPNLVDYGYDAQRHAVEITVQVNRDGSVTLAGARAGVGQQVRLLNLKWLSRSVRLQDSTGWVRIGASVVIPPERLSAEEHALTLLMGIVPEAPTEPAGEASPNSEIRATLQSLIVYDYERNLILAEWTRQPDDKPSPPKEE